MLAQSSTMYIRYNDLQNQIISIASDGIHNYGKIFRPVSWSGKNLPRTKKLMNAGPNWLDLDIFYV